MKKIEKVIYGNSKGDALNNFLKKTNSLKTKHKKFIKENKIDPDKIFDFYMSDYNVHFNIENQVVLGSELGKEIEKVFAESFSHLFKKD